MNLYVGKIVVRPMGKTEVLGAIIESPYAHPGLYYFSLESVKEGGGLFLFDTYGITNNYREPTFQEIKKAFYILKRGYKESTLVRHNYDLIIEKNIALFREEKLKRILK